MLQIFYTTLVILMLITETIAAQKPTRKTMHWKIAAEIPAAHGSHVSAGLAGAVSGISHDVLLVAGGNNFPEAMPWVGGKKKYYNDVYAYSKEKGRLVMKPGKWQLPAPIAYAAIAETQDGIIYAGGENGQGISNKTFLMRWDIASAGVIIESLPDLPLALSNAAAAVYHQQLYVAGGETINGVSDHIYLLNLDNSENGWTQLPSMPTPLSHMLAVIQSGGQHDCLFLLGGRKKNTTGISDLYATVFSFDLLTHQWQQKKSLPYALSAFTGVAGRHHQILLLGGDKGSTFHQTEKIIATLAATTDSVKKESLNRQKIQLQSTHPGFSKTILAYNTITQTTSVVGEIPYNAPVTTRACIWNNEIIIPGGEIRAGVRSNSILIADYNSLP